jgi:hypothetical protein
MKRFVIVSAVTFLSLPVISTVLLRTTHSGVVMAANASGTNDEGHGHRFRRLNPCSPPDHVSSSIEETAWRIWVAATCPVNQDQYPHVVWENWLEQSQLYPSDPANGLKVPNSMIQANTASHLLHASPLTIVKIPALRPSCPASWEQPIKTVIGPTRLPQTNQISSSARKYARTAPRKTTSPAAVSGTAMDKRRRPLLTVTSSFRRPR